MHAAHVAAASLNQTVGDWSGNVRRIVAAIEEARRRGARLLLLPELCLPGYSLGDRLLRDGTLQRSWDALTRVLPHTHGMVVCVGLPIRHHDVVYNAVAVLGDGKVWGLSAKEKLATGDVQYEHRWYAGWPGARVDTFTAPDGTQVPLGRILFEADGLGRFGIEICEDGWNGLRPGTVFAIAGAHMVLNPSASWFTLGKHRVRRDLVTQISREDRVAYLYSSLLGCDATRLVFDGSVFIAAGGRIVEEGRRFLFDAELEMVDRVLDLGALSQLRIEEGSWRQQVDDLHRGDLGPEPVLVRVEGDYTTATAPPPPAPYWEDGIGETHPDPSLAWLHEQGLIRKEPRGRDLPHLELELALAMALREYVAKCGIPGITLALSGGRDSSMVAVLVHRMHRYDRPDLDDEALKAHVGAHFDTAYLATDNSGDATRNAAAAVAAEVGASHHEVGIQSAFDTHRALTKAMTGVELTWQDHDIPLQNVQARLRGSLIWMLANLKGFLLLSTSNKSEAAVGYATMDGDTSGGLSPISDVPKSLVQTWLRWAAEFHGYQSLDLVLGTPATAELRPAEYKQTDEDDLMPFAVLDRLMYHFVQLGQSPLEMFQTLWPELSPRYGGDARAFADHIHKFVRKLCFAQWKRERFAIGFRVTAFDLDPKTGFRFPPVQAPFREELAELDAYVDQLPA